MRRSFSIFLILFFALGPLSVFIDSEDANLPACCRLHGTHHCAVASRMAATMSHATQGKTPQAEAPMTCQQYPGASVLFAARGPALTVAASNLPQLHEQVRFALANYATPESTIAPSHSGRGPPPQLI